MFLVRKCSCSLTSFSTQDRVLPPTSMAKPRKCLRTELSIILCLLVLALTGAFFVLFTRPAGTKVKAYFHPWACPDLPASMQHCLLMCWTCFFSGRLAWGFENKFWSCSKAWGSPPFPSRALYSKPRLRTYQKKKGRLQRMSVKHNHQLCCTATGSVWYIAGTWC